MTNGNETVNILTSVTDLINVWAYQILMSGGIEGIFDTFYAWSGKADCKKKYIWIESCDFEIVFMDWSSWKICLPFTETFVKVMLISR